MLPAWEARAFISWQRMLAGLCLWRSPEKVILYNLP